MDFERAREQVASLTNPRNVVLVGASDRPGSWAARVWRNLNRYKFPGTIQLYNPGRDEVFGEKCYRDFASMPEKPDHLIVLVPAKHVPNVLREGAAAGARSATVFSSGFGEGFDTQAGALGAELRQAIAETGLGVSGPNCMGNICGPSSFVTLTEDRPLNPAPGPVALVGQSGGVMIFVNQALGERGIKAGYLITSGNEAGLCAADYIAYFSTQPEIKVVVIYVEALKNIERFSAACRDARARGKHVVAIKLGASDAGRSAAMAHTGSLAGSLEAFDALAADLGIVRAATLDDAVEMTELLVHTGAIAGTEQRIRLGAITLSGAFRGMLLDTAETAGVEFPDLQPQTLDRLNDILGVGSLVSNPIDGGFGVLTSAENYINSIKALEADLNIDMLILQEGLPREPGSSRGEKYIAMVEDYIVNQASKPIAFITPVSHSQTDYSRKLRAGASHVSFLQEASRALRAIGAVANSTHTAALSSADSPVAPPNGDQQQYCAALAASAADAPVALNEHVSKGQLSAWGVPFVNEQLVHTPTDAVAAAMDIGYPIVLKAVSSTLLHKSNAGAVMLNITGEEQLRTAWASIIENVRAYEGGHAIEGMIVARQISGGVEMVLGLHRDPEAGLVLMIGTGGIWLELFKDVAFAVPPISKEKALHMVSQTKAAALLNGYRGAPVCDMDALTDAIVALGTFATHAGDSIESVDINPFVVLPKGQGAFALDALIVLKKNQSQA